MRVAAAGVVAIIAAMLLAHQPSARADESSPFPSPSPTASLAPGSGGYALVSIAGLSANGGQIPPSVTSPSPRPFAAAGATGFALELMGRMSTSYLALLRYQDSNIHGDDAAITSRFDVSALYQFTNTRASVGLSYASLQRSTLGATSNGLGLGFALIPDFSRPVSTYASAFYYPSLPAPGKTRGGLTVLHVGLNIQPPRATGVFARIGVETQNFSATSFSPTSLSGVEFGIGTTF